MSKDDALDYDALDYVAFQLCQIDHEKQGFAMSPRWWCLCTGLKERYQAEARTLIQKWAEAEREALAKSDAAQALRGG